MLQSIKRSVNDPYHRRRTATTATADSPRLNDMNHTEEEQEIIPLPFRRTTTRGGVPPRCVAISPPARKEAPNEALETRNRVLERELERCRRKLHDVASHSKNAYKLLEERYRYVHRSATVVTSSLQTSERKLEEVMLENMLIKAKREKPRDAYMHRLEQDNERLREQRLSLDAQIRLMRDQREEERTKRQRQQQSNGSNVELERVATSSISEDHLRRVEQDNERLRQQREYLESLVQQNPEHLSKEVEQLTTKLKTSQFEVRTLTCKLKHTDTVTAQNKLLYENYVRKLQANLSSRMIEKEELLREIKELKKQANKPLTTTETPAKDNEKEKLTAHNHELQLTIQALRKSKDALAFQNIYLKRQAKKLNERERANQKRGQGEECQIVSVSAAEIDATDEGGQMWDTVDGCAQECCSTAC